MNRRLCAKSGSPDLTLMSVPKSTFPSFKFLEHRPTFHICTQNKNIGTNIRILYSRCCAAQDRCSYWDRWGFVL